MKEGKYRLTIYATGIFGHFVHGGVAVHAGKTTAVAERWEPESAGTEVWRLGTPDKSSGEFQYGAALGPTHPLHPPEYLIYWEVYNWQDDFPKGVNYTIGRSSPTVDFNTVHWSVYDITTENKDVEYDTTRNWIIRFPMDEEQLKGIKTATLTIQLAAVKTASGNTDEYKPEPYSKLALKSYTNNQKEPLTMWIRYNQSSNCIVSSTVSCYQVRSRMSFPAN